MLVKKGAEIRSSEKSPGILLEVLYGSDKRKDILSFYLDNGLDINAVYGRKQQTILSKGGFDDLKWVAFLFEKGANPNVVLNRGKASALDNSRRDNRKQLTDLLLSYGALPYFDIVEYHHSMIRAIIDKDYPRVERLLVDVPYINNNIHYYNGGHAFATSVLGVAVSSLDKEMVSILLRYGADFGGSKWIRYQTENRIYRSKNSKRTEIYELLLENGLKIGLYSLIVAIRNEDEELAGVFIDYLKKYESKRESALREAIDIGSEGLVVRLLESGAGIDWKGSYRESPLELAYDKNNRKIVELLKAAGATVTSSIYHDSTRDRPLKWSNHSVHHIESLN